MPSFLCGIIQKKDKEGDTKRDTPGRDHSKDNGKRPIDKNSESRYQLSRKSR